MDFFGFVGRMLILSILIVDGHRLQGHTKPAFDDALFGHDRHLLYEWHTMHKTTQVDERATDEAKPGKSVVEWIATDHVFGGGGGR